MKPTVVKCGGAVAAGAADAILEVAASEPTVVVHGAGPQISAEMGRRGLRVDFVGGRRVTTREGLEVVPLCPFVARFIDRNPEYRDLLAADYRGDELTRR